MIRTDIKVTLADCPKKAAHEIIYMTRGSTACLNFDLFDKVYTIEDLEQFTYMFEQGRNVYYFNMVDYYQPTEDEEVIEGKKYFAAVNTLRYIEVIPEDGDIPKDKGWYEKANDVTDDWGLDSHFSYEEGDGYSYINLILTGEETARFKPTCNDDHVQVEVAIRLNTDQLPGMHNQDSIIVEKQHPVAIVDSIYSKII